MRQIRKSFAWLTILLLLAAALPAAALPNPVAPKDSAAQVWSETGLLLPVPTDARDIAYSVIDSALAQTTFAYDGVAYTLRLAKSPAFTDISGVYEDFPTPNVNEDYPGYECTYATNDTSAIAWWYDASRSASGSLCCSADGFGSFDLVLYEVLTGLQRGVCYAGSVKGGTSTFQLDYPILQTGNEALTAKLNESVLQGVQAVTDAYAPETRFEQQYMTAAFVGKLLIVEWGGTVVVPGVPYEDFILFSVQADCTTGDLAPLRAVLDTDQLAEATYPHRTDALLYQDWEDGTLSDAQKEYLTALTLDDWKSLLRQADFPAAEGWPPAFSAWRDSGYYRYEDDEFPYLIVNIGVPHALQTQLTMTFSAPQTGMDLMEILQIK